MMLSVEAALKSLHPEVAQTHTAKSPRSAPSRAFMVLWLLVIPAIAFGAAMTHADEPPLVVGVIAPMGRDFAVYGQGAVNGMQLANDTLEGRRLNLIVEDNAKCDAPSAVSAF